MRRASSVSKIRIYLRARAAVVILVIEVVTRVASRGKMKKAKKPAGKGRRLTNFKTDKRRKHRHFIVTVFYRDGEKFARVYTDRAKATRFAERQKKSPVVKATRILEVD